MSTVVRCLFAISDNERKKLNQDLDEQARKIDEAETQRFMVKWGYDPIRGVPVEGSDYEYTLMDRGSMPAMYTSVYRRRPSRPVSVLMPRSPARRNLISMSSAPTKRKLRFDDADTGSNDENKDFDGIICKQAKVDNSSMSNVSAVTTAVVNPLSSPPTSPPASSLQLFNSPRSPSVLSSSCPPVLDSDLVSDRLSSATDVPGLARSLSESTSLTQLSPASLARHYITPKERQREVKLVQREITGRPNSPLHY